MKVLKTFLLLSFIVLGVFTIKSGVSALYGGQPEPGYPFVGYLIADMKNGDLGQCGVNFLSRTTVITAAHCVKGIATDDIYIGTGDYNPSFRKTAHKAKQVIMEPNYKKPNNTFEAGKNDIAVIILEKPVSISRYVAITTPTISCDYYIVGYGQNEDKKLVDRRGIPVCIKALNDYHIEIEKSSQHFCVGDSGSGVYEKGTNMLVGIVSTFNSLSGECNQSLNYYAARIDANLEFVEKYYDENSSTNQPISEEDVEYISMEDDTQGSEGGEILGALICIFIIAICCVSIFGILLMVVVVFYLLKKVLS